MTKNKEIFNYRDDTIIKIKKSKMYLYALALIFICFCFYLFGFVNGTEINYNISVKIDGKNITTPTFLTMINDEYNCDGVMFKQYNGEWHCYKSLIFHEEEFTKKVIIR